MSSIAIKRALIAVYDKTGIAEFAKALVEEFGIEIISTGGTARHLEEAGVPVTMVEEVTGFPEMLDGRVKTLHPKIHAGILADRDNPDHMRQLEEHGIKPIDMVVVNLYPFKDTTAKPDCTFDEAIEMIDIGGPCMLRAAAKNHKHVVVVDRADFYEFVLGRLRSRRDEGDESGWADLHESGALGAFWTTAGYDADVASWLSSAQMTDGNPLVRTLRLWSSNRLRYGENPHQGADTFEIADDPDRWLLGAADAANIDAPSDVEMSFNNYADADAAMVLCGELAWGFATGREVSAPRGLKPVALPRVEGGVSSKEEPRAEARSSSSDMRRCCVFVKHTNACGVGMADDPVEAYRRAYLGDPNAAMGGILAVDFPVDTAFAEVVMGSLKRWGKEAGAGAFFVEVWLAPEFDEAAIEVIREAKKWGKRVRLLSVGDMATPPDENEMDLKRIAGGMLVQDHDAIGLNEDQWKVVTERKPSDAEMADLRLAWLVCKHTKSNAISLCKDGMLIGNGAGQMSRIMSCRIATWAAKENGHEAKLPGAVAASDAFFPFRDGPDILADAGITAIIQPGGSKRDADTIAACNERGIAMILTGTRHFKH